MSTRRFRCSWLLAVMLSMGGCAINPVTGDADFVLMSEATERQLGARYHQQILAQYGVYQDAPVQGLMERVGQRLARVSHRSELNFRFTLLDSPEVNAFALPGGYIYLTRGLLAYLGSEDELAAVLGHEIGHVTARHSVRQHSASTVTGLLGAIVGAQTDPGGQELVSFAGTALVRGYGRDHELEADRLGAEYLAAGGYQPEAMLEVIRVLKNQELHEVRQAKAEGRPAQVYHGLFATHPDNDRRLQEVIGAAQTLRASRAPAGDDLGFLRVLDGLVFGDSAAQGIVRKHRYYHRELGIVAVLPEGWRIENRRKRLIAVAPGRDAIVQLETLAVKADRSPVQLLHEQMRGARFAHEFEIAGHGRRGHGATVTLNTPFGVRDARVAIVIVGSTVLQISAAVDPSPWPGNYAAAIRETMFSLRPLRDDEQPLAEAQRLHLIRIESPQSIASLAKEADQADDMADQLRLLNKLYPDREPRVGQWLKVIR